MIRISHSSYPVAALTHPGMTGKNNEDRYAVSAYRLNRRNRKPVLLAVLTDGIGGHRAGEVASEIAVERISQAVAASDGSKPMDTLRKAIIQASQEIYTLASSDAQRQGMGTTCVCAWIIDKQLFTAAIGDSRLYLLRRGAIYQLSTDHTWVQEAVEQGILKPDQIKGHPNQHVIRRYIGSPNSPEVDFRLRTIGGGQNGFSESNQGMELRDGDRLLLCSDGLTDLVEDQEILSAYQQNPLDQASQSLVELANNRGGHDNITLVAIQVPKRNLVERVATSNRLFAAALIGAVMLTIFVFISLVIGFDWLNNRQGSVATPDVGVQPTQGLPVVLPSATLVEGGLPIQPATLTPEPKSIPTKTTNPTLSTVATATSAPPVHTPTAWPTNTLKPYP
jgi:serine/threonine protein phosphatase PrpC